VNPTADPREEMQAIVRSFTPEGVNWKVRVATAARKLGLSFSRAKDFYYADRRVRVSAEELQRAKQRIEGAARGTVQVTVEEESMPDRLARLAASHEAIAREISELRAALASRGDGRTDRG
jgi:hypothetical protein